eukprot:362895-Hanusia_phi.AAC.2
MLVFPHATPYLPYPDTVRTQYQKKRLWEVSGSIREYPGVSVDVARRAEGAWGKGGGNVREGNAAAEEHAGVEIEAIRTKKCEL